MKSFPMISSCFILILISTTFGTWKDEQEDEIEKFAQGLYPDANDEIFKQDYEVTSDLYDQVYESLENVRINDPGQYSASVNRLYNTANNIRDLITKIKPKTVWGGLLKEFAMEQILFVKKKIEQVTDEIEGYEVIYISKEDFMKVVLKTLINAKNNLINDLLHDNDLLIKESSELIKIGEQLVGDLVQLKPPDQISQTLIDGISIIMRKISAYCSNLIRINQFD